MHKVLGSPSINPFLFWAGKIAGYVVWLAFFIQLRHNLNHINGNISLVYLSYILFAIGFIIACISLIQLGNSVAAGIPQHETKLKAHGIYKFSRNPMYIGFHVMCIASTLHTLNITVLILTLFSIWIYHKIILGEENFLIQRFGNAYKTYCSRVNRYI